MNKSYFKSFKQKLNIFKSKNITAITMFIMMAVLVCSVFVYEPLVNAKDKFISSYVQTVYNQKNGIGSNEVNCLYQSSSGYIWIGTEGGLYRSNGSDFQSINLWDAERTDAYSINCITQDSTGRMWIGTDNYGLFYIEGGENYHLQDEYYNGVKKIIDVCETSDGIIYVATNEGLYTTELNKDENDKNVMSLVEYTVDNLSNTEFSSIVAFDNSIWAINGSSYIYIISENNCKIFDASEVCGNDLKSIRVFDDKIYVGTSGNEVICFNGLENYKVYNALVDGINSVFFDDNKYIWVCADNGLGYFDLNDNFIRVTDCEIDSYLSDMIQDYEGNYWISSTRMGVVLLSKSKFTDFNINVGMPESIVNCVYIYRGSKYIGTDDGLIIYDSKNDRVENDLTNMLSGISVRNITGDSENNLWISTNRRYGIVKYNSKGEISNISRTEGLPGASVNCSVQLHNGNIAVCTTNGVAILDKDNNVKQVFNKENGLNFENVLCVYQKDDNTLYIGTDGGGLYECDIISGDIVNYNSDNDGLNSNVIYCIKEGTEGIWLGTDNGLCFYNESFRRISNIEYSNSIYDIILQKGFVWIIGSKGILRTSEEELLGSEGLTGRYFDIEDGLSKTINSYSNSIIDGSGKLYICCNTGLCVLDTNNIAYNDVPPKIKVTAVDIDGVRYEFDDLNDGLKVKNDTSRITIYFAVFSYNNRSNIQVEYCLKGFDVDPIVISGNDTMEAVYTNLDGGVYEFFISASNGDGVKCESEVSFIIEKEKKFLEKQAARFFMIFLLLLGVFVIVICFIRITKMLKSKNQELEEISKEHEHAVKSSSAKNDYLANMSNEIKTPINAIMAKADELLHLIPYDADYRDHVQGIYDTSNNILGKVDDIILLAKIEAGKYVVTNEVYSISTMAYDISEYVISKLSDKSVKFFVEIGENISDNFIGDSSKIKDVLVRLLDNAIRYTKEGSITLSIDCYEMAESEGHGKVNLVFTVSDTGIGIQEERLENLFEVYNISDNKNINYSGNGVGLAITKGYVDLLNGEIEVSSVYGAGSTFTVSLSQQIAESVSGERIRSKIEETVSKEAAEKLWLPDVNVLLVDDDDVSKEVAVKVLSTFEAKIDIATSGISAIDMVMNQDYDVVFMNLSMPIMSGLDAMREIRDLEDDKYSMLPIISMDNNALEERKDELLGAGFTDTLVKPIELRRVAAILKDCLPGSKLKERSNDIVKYIEGSRYSYGLLSLKPQIDVESAIEKIGGSIDVFNKLMLAYYNQNNDAVVELYDKIDKNIRGFKNKIHALRTTSANIGAYSLAQAATRIEAAINIGNREYVHNNIGKFTDELLDILYLVEDYIRFADSVSGMTDEEYANKMAEENERKVNEENYEEITEDIIEQSEESNSVESIDFQLLEAIKNAVIEGDYQTADAVIQELMSINIVGEDKEFIAVLSENIANRQVEVINELVTTYMDLKL